MRDSKNATGPVLIFTTEEWDAFVRRVKDGEFDRRPNSAAHPMPEDAGVQTDPVRAARAVAWIESAALVLVALIGLAAHLLAR